MIDGRQASARGQRFVTAGYSGALALLIAGPLLGPGYLLLRDAVSTPRSYLTDSALGLGDAAPRAVPQDAAVATLSAVVDGGLVVRVVLVLALWAAGYGAAVAARELLRAPTAAQLVAITVAMWNPYVAERLLQGHWSLLTGYAALPWTALAAYRIRCAASRAHPSAPEPASTAPLPRREAIGGWAALTACLAAAGLTPTGALLAALVAVVTIGWRRLPWVLPPILLTAAPWLAATLLSGAGAEPSDPTGVAAFAARAEPGLGTLGSLAGLGGIWNADAVPAARATPLALIGTLILLALVAAGMRGVAASTRAPGAQQAAHDPDPATAVRRALLGLAAAAVVLPALAATGWGTGVLEWLVVHVPGAGLLRDTQKYVALAVPGYTLCAAAGCTAIAAALRRWNTAAADGTTEQAGPREHGPAVVATVLVVLLVAPLFDLAWGVGGAVRPVRYPDGWARVAATVTGDADVAVLPAGMFRRFEYSGPAPVLDPAPRMLPADVLQTGELPVRGRVVAGEGTRARTVEQLLLHGGSPAELAAQGVGWVLVERRTPGPLGESARTLADLEPVYADADLALYRVPGAANGTDAGAGRRRWAGLAHLAWAGALLGGLLVAGRCRRPVTLRHSP
ncbi:hypothetical protein [Nocardia farcinica]|uniref:hypothetical protein n=1 Tax=Nocardia farcinica TaxID=37329 RepID=UPI0037B391E7